jgi:hypothetical protein
MHGCSRISKDRTTGKTGSEVTEIHLNG